VGPRRGYFSRTLYPTGSGFYQRDSTLDVSLLALPLLGMLGPDDPKVRATVEAIHQRLWCQTQVGGLARYENDYYHQVSRDTEKVPGNPWFIGTLWLAQYYISAARSLVEPGTGQRVAVLGTAALITQRATAGAGQSLHWRTPISSAVDLEPRRIRENSAGLFGSLQTTQWGAGVSPLKYSSISCRNASASCVLVRWRHHASYALLAESVFIPIERQ
jgi:Glycosyl hydrolases family 15